MPIKRKTNDNGLIEIVKRGELKYERLSIFKGKKGESAELKSDDEEAVVVLLSGMMKVDVEGKIFNTGYRKDVFSSNAWAVYIPPGKTFKIKAVIDSEIAIAFAIASRGPEPFMVKPEEVKTRSVGIWNWRRDVKDIVDLRHDAEKLLVGETLNPPGNWSSWPPHKHDEDNFPIEVRTEEIYYFKIKPPTGFGIQRIYDKKGLDEVHAVFDGDTTLLPRGYHPVVAAPGYSLYYLWIIAGEKRMLLMNDDPDHAWQKCEEALLREVLRREPV